MTGKLVVLTEAAKADVKGIARWYGRQRAGLRAQFRASVRATISSIGAHPEVLRLFHLDARRASIDGFPHGVFFLVEAERVVVFAIKHPSQHPSSWQSRLPA